MTMDQTGALIIFGIFAFMAYQRFALSNESDRLEATEKAAKKLENNDEIKFIRDQKTLLPDSNSIISTLRERYTWQQIFEAYGVGVLEMELLRTIPSCSKISLPNLRALDQTDKEHQVLMVAKISRSYSNDDDDLEDWVQEPTTQTLHKLVITRLVESSETDDDSHRNFEVSVTLRGNALLELDDKFRDKNSRFETPNRFIDNHEARIEFSSLVKLAIECHKDNLEKLGTDTDY